MPHRLHDPIPRSESLAALTREIAADAHERAHDELDGYRHVLQAAVLMEARDHDRSVMHPIAYYHEYCNAVPRAGDPEDPRQLRIPGLEEDWRRFLDEGKARVFRWGSAGEEPVSAGLRVPFLAWIGRHAARGVLTLDLRSLERELTGGFRDDLMLLARRLAAGLTAAGSSLPHGEFISRTHPDQFAKRLCAHLKADMLELHLGKGDLLISSNRDGAPRQSEIREDDWRAPTIRFERQDRHGETGPDPDANLWGVQEAGDEGSISLHIPLVFGMARVGHIVARWSGSARAGFGDDPQTTRALWIRDILAAWSLWSWRWPMDRDDALVYVDVQECDGAWTSTPRFRKRSPCQPSDHQSQARLARELMVAVAGGRGFV